MRNKLLLISLFVSSFFFVGSVFARSLGMLVSPFTGLNYGLNKVGVNVISIGVKWSLAEPANNTYNWTLFDKWINESAKDGYKIDVLIDVGSEPSWVYTVCPNAHMKYENGVNYSSQAGYLDWAFDDPCIRNLAKQFIKKVIGRYKNIKNIEAWIVSPNEFDWKDVWEDKSPHYTSYDVNTIKDFIEQTGNSRVPINKTDIAYINLYNDTFTTYNTSFWNNPQPSYVTLGNGYVTVTATSYNSNYLESQVKYKIGIKVDYVVNITAPVGGTRNYYIGLLNGTNNKICFVFNTKGYIILYSEVNGVTKVWYNTTIKYTNNTKYYLSIYWTPHKVAWYVNGNQVLYYTDITRYPLVKENLFVKAYAGGTEVASINIYNVHVSIANEDVWYDWERWKENNIINFVNDLVDYAKSLDNSGYKRFFVVKPAFIFDYKNYTYGCVNLIKLAEMTHANVVGLDLYENYLDFYYRMNPVIKHNRTLWLLEINGPLYPLTYWTPDQALVNISIPFTYGAKNVTVFQWALGSRLLYPNGTWRPMVYGVQKLSKYYKYLINSPFVNSKPEIAILYPVTPLIMRNTYDYIDEFKGIAYALKDSGYDYVFIDPTDNFSKYKIIYVPFYEYINLDPYSKVNLTAKFINYIKHGGHLVITGRSFLKDTAGYFVKNAFFKIFGVSPYYRAYQTGSIFDYKIVNYSRYIGLKPGTILKMYDYNEYTVLNGTVIDNRSGILVTDGGHVIIFGGLIGKEYYYTCRYSKHCDNTARIAITAIARALGIPRLYDINITNNRYNFIVNEGKIQFVSDHPIANYTNKTNYINFLVLGINHPRHVMILLPKHYVSSQTTMISPRSHLENITSLQDNLTIYKTFIVDPLYNRVNITLHKYTDYKVSFTANSTKGNVVKFYICNLKPYTKYAFSVDGRFVRDITSDNKGCIDITWRRWSNHNFVLEAETEQKPNLLILKLLHELSKYEYIIILGFIITVLLVAFVYIKQF